MIAVRLSTVSEQVQPGASIPPEAMVRPPKMAEWVPQFLIIMHLKCCADR